MASRSVCGIEGCNKPSRAGKLGLCSMHEARLKRHGSPLTCLKPKGQTHHIAIGDQFRDLTVVSEAEKTTHERRWNLRCVCGSSLTRATYQLTSGASTNCGCRRSATHDANGRLKSSHIDLAVGSIFGRLIVLGDETKVDRNYWVTCRCDCGVEVRCRVDGLTSGKKLQCGAHKRVRTAAQRAALSERLTTHGMSGTPEYNSWCGMKSRCGNVNDSRYSEYGGRGITICAEWEYDFEAFLKYVGPRPSKNHSLDRIKVDGNYEPGNVRWADAPTQSRNRRPFMLRPSKFHEPTKEPTYIRPPSIPATHGNQRHGMSKTPEYQAWCSMKKRCLDPRHPAYRNYGARGVGVHKPWIDNFASFLVEVGMRPEGRYSLDRRDNSKGYEPGNVRWSDSSTQNRNRRPFLITPKQRAAE